MVLYRRERPTWAPSVASCADRLIGMVCMHTCGLVPEEAEWGYERVRGRSGHFQSPVLRTDALVRCVCCRSEGDRVGLSTVEETGLVAFNTQELLVVPTDTLACIAFYKSGGDRVGLLKCARPAWGPSVVSRSNAWPRCVGTVWRGPCGATAVGDTGVGDFGRQSWSVWCDVYAVQEGETWCCPV